MGVTADVIYCIIVSLLWGVTNPLIKISTKNIKNVSSKNLFERLLNELKYLILNWKYVSLFGINQIGSVLFFLVLQKGELSLVVPTANALTFVFTGLVGVFLGEETPNLRITAGIGFVIAGITFCILDKIDNQTLET